MVTTLSILVTTCREMGASPGDVRGPDRRRAVMNVRKEVARRCRRAGHSLTAIGRVLGGRHHTTVLWLIRGGHPKTKRARLVHARWLVAHGAGL